MLLVQLADAEAKPVEGAGGEVLHDNIGGCDESLRGRHSALFTQVQAYAPLVAVEPGEVSGSAVDRAVVATGEIALADALNFNYVRTEVGEVTGAERPRDRLLEANDAEAMQRQVRSVHPTSLRGALA